MEDVIDALHGLIHDGAIGHAAFDEGMGNAIEVTTVTGAEVVEDDDLSLRLEVLREMATDETGTACDEDAHGEFGGKEGR